MGAHVKRDAGHRVADAIRRIVQLLRESGRAVESELGISGAQLFVLQKLRDEGSATVGELAAKTLTHQSSVSTVLAKLEARGLVQRKPAPEDRRVVRVHLTPAGSRLVDRAPDPAQLRLIEAVQALPAGEQRTLAELLERMLEGMGLPRAGVPPMLLEEKPARRSKTGAARTRPTRKRRPIEQ